MVRILTDEELEHIGRFLKREPTDLEKDVFDILWSERVSYRSSRQWFKEFYTEDEKVIFGIGEGAALIDLGDDVFLSIAMESRNHTTQKDPFHGSAIGVGGIIRDVLSHGCKAVGLMNFLHIETPTKKTSVENLELIVRGISDYGNSVGIPMIGGDTEFDDIFDKACIINLVCIGGFDRQKVREHLAIPEGILPVGMLYVGYPDEDKPPRTRYLEQAVHWGRYDTKRAQEPRPGNILVFGPEASL